MSLEVSGSSLEKVFIGIEAFSRDGCFATTQGGKRLGLGMPTQKNNALQVCVREGNIDGQLITSQHSPETIDVLAHVP